MEYNDLFVAGKDLEIARQLAEQTEEQLTDFAINGTKIVDAKGTVTGSRLLGPDAKPLVNQLFGNKPDPPPVAEVNEVDESSSSDSGSGSSDSEEDEEGGDEVLEESTPIQNNLKTSRGPSIVPSGLQTLSPQSTPSVGSIQKLSTNKMVQLQADSDAMHNMMGDPTLKAIRGDTIKTHSAVGYLQEQVGLLTRKVAELTEAIEPLARMHADIKHLTNLLEHATIATANPSRPGSEVTRLYGHTGIHDREEHIGILADREKTASSTFSLLSARGGKGDREYGKETEDSIMERIPIMLSRLSAGARAEMASEYINREDDFDAEMFLAKVMSMIEAESVL